MRSYLIVLLYALMTGPLIASGANAASALPAQSNATAGVTVKAAPRALSGGAWEFEIVFDTHSQDLKDDLVKSAVLVVDGGAVSVPIAWQGDPPGGHHRKGVLKFNAVDPRAQEIELRITRPGEPAPRVLRWQLK